MYRSMLTTLMLTPPSHPMTGASLVAQKVKNPLAMKETGVPSLGQVDPLEKVMATHSSILAWRIPRAEGPGGLQSMGSQRVRQNSSSFVVATIQI